MKRLNLLKPRPALIGLLIALSLVVAACSAAPATETPLTPMPAGNDKTVRVADNPVLGQVLTTAEGLTLYTNTAASPQDLRCIDEACVRFWPPYTIDAEPTSGEELQGTLGTVSHPDGAMQVTYNDQPLFTFYLDSQPGDVNGEGVTDLGGTWHAVTP
jgi:predicted lipoprotein with Yx(FWY)xxD motif